MGMWIDEAWSYDQPSRIDCSRGSGVLFARVADKDDAIASNANIGGPRLLAGTVDELSVQDKEVERHTAWRLCGGSDGKKPDLRECGQRNRDQKRS